MSSSYSQGRIVLMPGRMSGQPTIGDSRLPVRDVVETYLQHGFNETTKMWEYLTETDIKLACWWWHEYYYAGQAGILCPWADDNQSALNAGDWDAVPMPPWGYR